MALNKPTRDTIRQVILAIWQGERPTADSTKYSDLWLFSEVGSALVLRLHSTIERALDAVFPTTSFDSYLDNWLSWLGLPDGQGGFGRILPGISAAGSGFTIETVAGMAANLTLNKTLTDSAGKSYIITEQNAIIAPGGTEDVDIESVTTGYGVNLESGTVLTWDAPPAGADATGTLAKDLTGGTGLEEDSAGRVRLLGKLRNPPASGNVASWVATIEAVSAGNLKAWVWPQRQNYPQGYGLTDYCATYLLETGTDRHIAAVDDMYSDIDTAVDDALPALIYRNSRQLTLVTAAVDVEITITLGDDATADQKCDWDAVSANPDGAAQTTVATNDAGGNTIVTVGSSTSPTLTDGLKAGDKFVVNGVEAECASVTNATTFEVASWPAGFGTALNSLAGYNITAGGGFIGWKTEYDNDVTGSGLVEAVRAYMDERGPNVSYAAAQSEIPGWDSTARIQQIESACFVVGGGVIVDVVVDDLGGGVIDLAHASESGATALIYDVD